MAYIRRRKLATKITYQAQVRRVGFKTIIKSFSTRKDAKKWATHMERNLDTGVSSDFHEASAAFLRDNIGSENEFIEWVVVRPDGLINAEISNYEVVATPPRTIFNGLTTTRANVAHFMCELIEKQNLWSHWQGKMPVIFNK